MAVQIRIPTPLRTFTDGKAEIKIEGGTVSELINNLEAKHPGIKERICDDNGVRRFVNIFANDEDIRFLDGLNTKIEENQVLSIVPAIAGGI